MRDAKRHRPTAPLERLFPKGLLEAAGVTRIARVTGLDRTQVEVACAVRPQGHILQVSQGKGDTFASAALSAGFEAVELWAAENPDSERFRWSTYEALSREGNVWGPLELAMSNEPGLWSPRLLIPWVRASRLGPKGEVWVPARAVYCPNPSHIDAGPQVTRWTSNGLGAGSTRSRALRHALLELFERHVLSKVLPEGWTERAAKGRRVRATGKLMDSLEAQGFEVAAFDLSLPNAPPVAGVLLRSEDRGAQALTAGYACRLKFGDAVHSAVLEAAQSRLTDIHGAREDVAHQGAQANDAEPFFRMPARPGAPRARDWKPSTPAQWAARAGLRVACVDLVPRSKRYAVVKALSCDAQASELLA